MKPTVVVDASVILALVRDETRAPEVRRAIERWKRERTELMAPPHMWLEVSNSLARRHGFSGARILEASASVGALSIARVPVDDALMLGVIDLLERHALSAYDAAYLAAAETVDGQLATFDRRLASAAGPRAFRWKREPVRPSELSASYEAEPTWPRWRGAEAYIARIRARRAESDGVGTYRGRQRHRVPRSGEVSQP